MSSPEQEAIAGGAQKAVTGPQYLQRPTVPVGPKAGAEVATVVIWIIYTEKIKIQYPSATVMALFSKLK